MLKWLFFDLGSTLVDESDCEEFRLRHLLSQPGAPERGEVEQMLARFAGRNLPHYKETARALGLETAPWPSKLEKLYPGVPELLAKLHGHYKLGIIANQNPGTEQRLEAFGIRQYFDAVAASGEQGSAKPDPAIFRAAFQMAGCSACEAAMIGDRLDNDIAPAQKLGMTTVWVRQGFGGLGDPGLLDMPPDFTAQNITEIWQIFEKKLDCEPTS